MTELLINLIQHIKYPGIFIGTFLEGPTIGLFAGFMAKVGIISLTAAYSLHVAGDLAADFFYFLLGYKRADRYLGRFGRKARTMAESSRIQKLLVNHPGKAVIIGKLSHIFAFPTLIALGVARYPWYKFLLFDLVATLIKSTFLIGVGYYLGELWTKANNIMSYVGIAGIIMMLALGGYFAIMFIRSEVSEEVSNNQGTKFE